MTFIRSGNYMGQLKEMLSLLPKDFGPLSRVKVSCPPSSGIPKRRVAPPAPALPLIACSHGCLCVLVVPQVFTSLDQSLVLNTFTAGTESENLKPTPKDMEAILQYAEELQV